MANRPDTGTRNNMIVNMAASIMNSKKDHFIMVVDIFKEKPGNEDRVTKLTSQIKAIEAAVELMDENEGCWG